MTCRSLSRRSRGRSSTTSMTSTVDLEVGDQLLLLGEHRLQSVQLGLQLLNGDLRLALGSGRVLVISDMWRAV